nr:receptor-like protein 12 [Ipomoea batatas]
MALVPIYCFSIISQSLRYSLYLILVSHLRKLESLILQQNRELVGSLPKLSWNCNHSLQVLDIGLTNISGEIPNSIGNLKSLKYFLVASGSFFGKIPNSIGNLTHLKVMNFQGNELSGSLPPTISNLNQLTDIFLSNNHFEGEIPDIFSNLQDLINLYLYQSNFSGCFPSSIVNLTQLEVLELTGNSLTGPLPLGLTRLQKLQWLGLSRNMLNGTIPPWVFCIPSSLGLSQNQFIGHLPEISCNSSLAGIDLSNNQLDGLIPQSISKLVHVEVLNLASNNFSGEVLTEIFLNIKNLSVLNLQSNKFNGTIPPWIFCIPFLYELDLSQNQFTGNLPEISCKSSLSKLDLSNNQLDGLIPHSISKLLKANSLFLASNNFNGTIPPWIFIIPSLLGLDLSRNRFTGKLPEISNKSSLVFVDLSNNQLDGLIPHSISNLLHATFLKFASNNFSGEVVITDASITSDVWRRMVQISVNPSIKHSKPLHPDTHLSLVDGDKIPSLNSSESNNLQSVAASNYMRKAGETHGSVEVDISIGDGTGS